MDLSSGPGLHVSTASGLSTSPRSNRRGRAETRNNSAAPADPVSSFGLTPGAVRDARRALVRTFDETTLHKFEALDERFYACPEDSDEMLEVYLNRINQRADGTA